MPLMMANGSILISHRMLGQIESNPERYDIKQTLCSVECSCINTTWGFIFFNFLLYNQVKKYYFELNQTRLDPLGLGYYPVNSKEVTGTHLFRVVFFGDSRAASWTPPNVNGYEFINRGISSQTSVQAIDRFSYHVRPLKPDVVIVQVGINDLKTVALFPEHRKLIVANCQSNIKRIIEESRNLV